VASSKSGLRCFSVKKNTEIHEDLLTSCATEVFEAGNDRSSLAGHTGHISRTLFS
jgi:hypothetical protein